MDTEQPDTLSPGQRETDAADDTDHELEVVETPLPKRVRPGESDPRIRKTVDRRIQKPR